MTKTEFQDRVKEMCLTVLEGIFQVKDIREEVFESIESDVASVLYYIEYPYISHVQAAVEIVLRNRICK